MAKKFWWPKTLAEQANEVKNYHDKIESYKGPLDLDGAFIDATKINCESIMNAYNFREQTAETDKAVTEWRDQVYYGTPKGADASPPPVYATFSGAAPKRGCVTQFFDDRDYILGLPGYTEAIGDDLGFVGTEQDAPDLGSFQPTLKADAAAQGGFAFGVTVGNRGDSDQWILSGALVGTTDWQQLGVNTGKTADGTWPGGGPQPITVQMPVQLRLKNENYGQPSNIVLVTLIP